MTIRRDGIIISSELLEKLKNLSFINETSFPFTTEEVYLCKLINDAGLEIEEIRPSFIFDINHKCIRRIKEIKDSDIVCEALDADIIVTFDKALNLPVWTEARKWIKNKGFKLDFHYDPFSDTEGIKIGFMKSRALTGTDNVIVEADGRTDLEAIYKIILEVLKYEKKNPPELLFNLTVKPSVKSILLFFFLLLIQIISLAGILIFSFKIELSDIIAEKNIPDLAKYLYLSGLYFFMLLNLYLFDPQNFLSVFYLSRTRSGNFIKGFTIAFLALLILYILEILLGFTELKVFTINFVLLGQIIFFSFCIALIEELLFRNFIFRKLKEDYSLNTALIVSAYIYAQLHFLKFNLSLSEIILPLTGLFFVGIILAHTFYYRDLWFSIGMHSAWIILISYTNQESVFIINNDYYLLTGGYYPIAGILGIIMTLILLYELRLIKEKV